MHGRRDVIHSKKQRAHAQNEQAVQRAQAKAERYQRVGHALHAGVTSLAHRAPRKHRSRVSHPVEGDERQLVQHHGNAACRHECAADLPHDDAGYRAAKPPQKLVAHHGQAVAEIFAQQLFIPGEAIFDAKTHQLFFCIHINKRQNQLGTARAHRAYGRAAHAQGGRAQLAKNENVIENYIHKKAAPVYAYGHFHLLCAAQAGKVTRCQRIGQIAERHHRKVACPSLNHLCIRGKNAQNLMRKGQRQQREHTDGAKHRLHGKAHHFSDMGHILFAPVLGNQHAAARGQAVRTAHHQRLHLIAKVCAGDCHVPKAAQHHTVHQRHPEADGILKSHGPRNGQQVPVERLFCNEFLFQRRFQGLPLFLFRPRAGRHRRRHRGFMRFSVGCPRGASW